MDDSANSTAQQPPKSDVVQCRADCTDEDDERVPPPAWLVRYVAFLARYKLLVLLFWAAVMGVGYLGLSRVFPALMLRISAVPGSADDVALRALEAAFPQVASAQTTAVLLQAPSGVDVTTSAAAHALASALSATAASYIASGLLSPSSGVSYYSYADAGLASSPLAQGLLSPSRSAALVQFTSNSGFKVTEQFKQFVVALNKQVGAANAANGDALHATVTGALVLLSDANQQLLKDAAITDSITLFLAFGMLAAALRSFRFMALACSCLAVSGGACFLLTWALTTAVETPNFAVSVILSTLFALCLDYSLFLLSHVRESLAKGMAIEPAVVAMLASSGHTVLVSGLTLCSCFLVLGIFPINALRAPGIATSFAVAMSVCVALSYLPAVLLTVPGFFLPDCVDGGSMRKWPRMRALEQRIIVASNAVWGGVARLTRTWRVTVALLILALLVAPFAYRLKSFETTTDYRNLVPKDSADVRGMYDIIASFGSAYIFPVTLLGVARAPATAPALSTAFFASAQAAVSAALAAGEPGILPPTAVAGLAWPSSNATATIGAIRAAAACPAVTPAACTAACPAALCGAALASSTLSADGSAMLLSLYPRVVQDSDASVAWVRAVRSALERHNAQDTVAQWLLVVDPTAETFRYIYAQLGKLVGITVAVILFIITAFFRSVPTAIRAVVTLAVMEITVWGSAVAIYDQGILNPGGVVRTFTSEFGLFYFMPILAFSLVTGLGLDYDVFIITAVFEERQKGYSDQDAISLGLLRSGPVISIAGLIMCVAFGGYLFSSIPLLNQLGLFVVFGVLLDTFVVRPLLVPAIMHLLGRWNFWPVRMPAPTKPPFDLDAFRHAGTAAGATEAKSWPTAELVTSSPV